MYDFYLNLISGLVGAFILYIIQQTYRFVIEQNSPYTGLWYDSIYDDNGKVIKRDTFDMRQRGNKLTGKIFRTSPLEQRHRKWLFVGELRGNRFFAIFWSTTVDIPSYGCWYLTQVDDDLFVGYYLSLQRTINNEDVSKITESLKPIKLTLERKRAYPK